MAFDTFDEGISLGGMRSKTEIRTLICYMYKSVGSPMSKETIINALMEKGLANYFEVSASFDDLLRNGNIALVDEEKGLYFITGNGRMIATQLEDTLAPTVRERATECALALLKREQVESENKVTITKCENGYNVNCRISGGHHSGSPDTQELLQEPRYLLLGHHRNADAQQAQRDRDTRRARLGNIKAVIPRGFSPVGIPQSGYPSFHSLFAGSPLLR